MAVRPLTNSGSATDDQAAELGRATTTKRVGDVRHEGDRDDGLRYVSQWLTTRTDDSHRGHTSSPSDQEWWSWGYRRLVRSAFRVVLMWGRDDVQETQVGTDCRPFVTEAS
jgi:hypothetical protein